MQLAQKVLGIAILVLLAVSIAGAAFSGHGWCALGIVCLTLLCSSMARWISNLAERAALNISFGASSLRAHSGVLKLLRETDARASRVESRIVELAKLECETLLFDKSMVAAMRAHGEEVRRMEARIAALEAPRVPVTRRVVN